MTTGEQIRKEGSTCLALGTTYEGYNPELLERVLPLVDYLEVTPDTLAEVRDGTLQLHEPAMAELKNVGAAARIIVHGVGLSIGSHDTWSEQYIRLLDDFMSRVDVVWHSEHLGYTTVDGEHLGTMLAMPKTEEALDLVCERVQRIQERFALPFLLENIVHILPDFPGDYSEAGFLNALCARSGCGLLLDAYNLECDAHNYGFDITAFLAELELANVREVHVACGVEHQGFLVDVHSRHTRPSTIALAQQIVALAQGAVQVVTYEFLREALPILGIEGIADELHSLRQALQ